MADYKNKIRKLLALAESPVEAEAKAALLKARQLMATHKLTEAELNQIKNKEVKKVFLDITCSKRKNPWIMQLSIVIAQNYCCKSLRSHKYKQQTQQMGFIGLEDDIEICIMVYKYAVDCISAEIERIKKICKGRYNSYEIKRQCDGYGFGFAIGIQEAFENQQKNEQDWGLILAVPKEVLEASKEIHKDKRFLLQNINISQNTFDKGYREGTKFNPKNRLGDGKSNE